MKVIDLLNKIANGEEAPNKIKYDKIIWHLKEDKLYYNGNQWLEEYCNITQCLNDEVEIIEEDKKIRKIKTEYSPDIEEEIFYVDGNKPNHCILGDNGTKLIINKINEIIDKINKE